MGKILFSLLFVCFIFGKTLSYPSSDDIYDLDRYLDEDHLEEEEQDNDVENIINDKPEEQQEQEETNNQDKRSLDTSSESTTTSSIDGAKIISTINKIISTPEKANQLEKIFDKTKAIFKNENSREIIKEIARKFSLLLNKDENKELLKEMMNEVKTIYMNDENREFVNLIDEAKMRLLKNEYFHNIMGKVLDSIERMMGDTQTMRLIKLSLAAKNKLIQSNDIGNIGNTFSEIVSDPNKMMFISDLQNRLMGGGDRIVSSKTVGNLIAAPRQMATSLLSVPQKMLDNTLKPALKLALPGFRPNQRNVNTRGYSFL